MEAADWLEYYGKIILIDMPKTFVVVVSFFVKRIKLSKWCKYCRQSVFLLQYVYECYTRHTCCVYKVTFTSETISCYYSNRPMFPPAWKVFIFSPPPTLPRKKTKQNKTILNSFFTRHCNWKSYTYVFVYRIFLGIPMVTGVDISTIIRLIRRIDNITASIKILLSFI